MTILEIVRSKLPNSTLMDPQINVLIDEVAQLISTYCNRQDVPNELRFVHANMVVDLILLEEQRGSSESNLITKSVTEGDTQVVFEQKKSTSSELVSQSVLLNYTAQLNKFRKLRR